MNEWKPMLDVLKNIPENKYKSFSRLGVPVRYKANYRKYIGHTEEWRGKVGKIYYYDNGYSFNLIEKDIITFVSADLVEVWIDEKTMGRLFVWAME